ncbi:SIS domain-containing protein [Paenibacillus sp. HB172176]|uniref:SIS domain-containing protein n=1 Tax=Paenibacillus sp. HB172176 TaxID=2493690 RepID=UPI00143A377B|nr:SIS domain-containing protein [Paenibacillus sp. HB172176]
MSLTYSEIKQQYEALRLTFAYMLSQRDRLTAFMKESEASSIAFVGCGSSYALSVSAARSFQLRGGIPAYAFAGGDLMLNASRYRSTLRGALLVLPSRSGSTTEIMEAIPLLQQDERRPLLALTCVQDSPLSKVADYALELPWAFDNSVCQTRTVTNLYVANLMLAAFYGNDDALIDSIREAVAHGETFMSGSEQAIRRTAGFAWENAVVLADGELNGLAAEGAIAMTEIANAQAHAHHLLDVRHGPMVTIGRDTLVLAALNDGGFEYQLKLLADLKARGATVIAYIDQDEARQLYLSAADLVVSSNMKLDFAVRGIPFIFIAQIAAICGADRQGINPDQPDGLDAWVKL